MYSETKNVRSFWLTLIAAAFLIDVAAMRASFVRANELGMDLTRSAWGGILLLYLAAAIVCLWMFVRVARAEGARFPLLSRLDTPVFESLPWRAAAFLLFVAILFLIPWIKFSFNIGRTIENPSVDPLLIRHLYFWLCAWSMLFAMLTLKVALRTSWPVAFISAMVILGVAYELWIRFGAVTTYPLSMGWSEGSR